jgi:tetratricopeptide (TPR) repeat protein
VFDRYALAKRYEVSAQRTMLMPSFDESFFVKFVQGGIAQYDIAVKQHPERGEVWFRLASIGLLSDLAYRSVSHERITEAVEQSIRLASVRVEPFIAEAYQLDLEGKTPEAIELLTTVLDRVPTSPKLLWALAAMYYHLGNIDTAADFGYRGIDDGVSVSAAQNILWVADYYAQKNDFEKVVRVYQRAHDVEPENVALLPNLLAAYVQINRIDKAIAVAELIVKKDPEHAAKAREFISQAQSIR